MATPIDRRTHLPVNLADWRLQRCMNSTSGGARAARDAKRAGNVASGPFGSTVADASAGGCAPAGQSGPLTPYEPWQDNLRAARGIGLACLLGALMWAIGIAFIVAVWPQ